MASDLRRAMGTLTQEAFDRAAQRFPRMDRDNLEIARTFLVQPGTLQVDIAQQRNISRQLVRKHCKKLYDAHCQIVDGTQEH